MRHFSFSELTVWINPAQHFGDVPAAVWNCHIGGYPVCEKWLKNRKSRTLSYEDPNTTSESLRP